MKDELDDIIASGDKDVLADFMRERLRAPRVDMRKPFDALAAQARALIVEEVPQQKRWKTSAVQWLKHPKTGHVFKATELLLERGDMIPVDGPAE